MWVAAGPKTLNWIYGQSSHILNTKHAADRPRDQGADAGDRAESLPHRAPPGSVGELEWAGGWPFLASWGRQVSSWVSGFGGFINKLRPGAGFLFSF
jgi:hypothetical protein